MIGVAVLMLISRSKIQVPQRLSRGLLPSMRHGLWITFGALPWFPARVPSTRLLLQNGTRILLLGLLLPLVFQAVASLPLLLLMW